MERSIKIRSSLPNISRRSAAQGSLDAAVQLLVPLPADLTRLPPLMESFRFQFNMLPEDQGALERFARLRECFRERIAFSFLDASPLTWLLSLIFHSPGAIRAESMRA